MAELIVIVADVFIPVVSYAVLVCDLFVLLLVAFNPGTEEQCDYLSAVVACQTLGCMCTYVPIPMYVRTYVCIRICI